MVELDTVTQMVEAVVQVVEQVQKTDQSHLQEALVYQVRDTTVETLVLTFPHGKQLAVVELESLVRMEPV